MGRIEIGKNANLRLLYCSLLLIWAGSVISARFNSWYAIVGGAAIAVLGCFLNQLSVKWVTNRKNGNGGAYIKTKE